jgi:Zn-dependent peptidase ImmA (M78 family)
MSFFGPHFEIDQDALSSLAKATGVEPDRIRSIGRGSEPTLREARVLSRALSMPMVPKAHDLDLEVMFRSTHADIDSNLLQQNLLTFEQFKDVLELAATLAKNSDWIRAFDELRRSRSPPALFAAHFRSNFCDSNELDPLDALPQIMEERLGAFVLRARDRGIEGASAVLNGFSVVLVAPRSFAPRMLFTLAHEIGHLVAHHNLTESKSVFLDKEIRPSRLSADTNDQERFANEFASVLLLPSAGVLRALREIRSHLGASGQLGDIEISMLSRFFGVSFEVAAYRCESMSLLPMGGANALYQVVKDKYGNPEQRAESEGLPPRNAISLSISKVLMDRAAGLVRSGELSIGRAAEMLNCPLENLMAHNRVLHL